MSPQTQLDLNAVKAAMTAVNNLFNSEVFGKGNFGILDQVYTSDARILPPGGPMVSGREEIKEFWAKTIASLNAKSAVLESVEVMPAGDGCVEIGKATLSIEPGGSAMQVEAKYVVYWRMEDGQWKWHVDIWNMNG